jgi:hypothetical protein
VKWASAAVIALAMTAMGLMGSASEQQSIVHALSQGEKFVYARVITYRDTTGIQHERSTITLEVLDSASPSSVRQRISVNGGPEKVREIKALPDGRWSYPDHDSIAQDFVTWDANQFGKAPADLQPGQTWPVVVPQSAMFTAGRALVKVISNHDRRVTIEATGDSGRRDETILDRDTHKYVPVSVRGTWTVRVTYDDGIMQEFHRDDRVHYVVNRSAANTDDDVDVSIRLVNHTT